jgi:hypothetical protein
MARAGFVYTPQQSNDDLVTCLYCDTSLSGWDADDDPMYAPFLFYLINYMVCSFFKTTLFREEHRRRKKSCPFFSTSESALTNRIGSQSQSTKPPSKSKPPTRSASKSKHQDILLPTKTHDGDPDNDSDSSPPIKIGSRSKSVTRSEPEESNAEGEIQKKMLRSRSKTKAKDSENVPRKSSRPKAKASRSHEVPPKPSRTRSKTKVFESEPEEEPLTTVKPRSTSQPEPQMRIPTVSSIREIHAVSDVELEPEPETTSLPAPSTSQRSLPQTLVVQPNDPLPSDPTVLPILEINETEPELETNNHVYPAPSTLQHSLPQTPPKTLLPALSKLVVQPHNPLPSVPAVSPIQAIDVVAPEPEPETNSHVYTAPSTLQRSLPQTPPKVIFPLKAAPSTTVELIPALSKLPSIPLHTLTEAELDMTVEDWIRYQMDVEYDKFRRDGERELQRFRNQAEEVRKTIEGL